jgi:hypothetical protein
MRIKVLNQAHDQEKVMNLHCHDGGEMTRRCFLSFRWLLDWFVAKTWHGLG